LKIRKTLTVHAPMPAMEVRVVTPSSSAMAHNCRTDFRFVANQVASSRIVRAFEVDSPTAPICLEVSVNYNTYVLGCEGYISLDLVTAVSSEEHDRPVALQLLAAIEFKDGKRYADFNPSTDKVATYGLAALIAGVAAKKLGLLALIAARAVKFWKLIAVAMFGATIGKLLTTAGTMLLSWRLAGRFNG
jgi:uncharacterized membrane-anchored protein